MSATIGAGNRSLGTTDARGSVGNSSVPRTTHPWNLGFEWKASPRQPNTLSEHQLDQFDELGFTVCEQVFDASAVAEITAELSAGVQRVRDLLEALPDRRLSVAGLDTQLVAPHVASMSPVLGQTCAHPMLLGAAHDLLGPRVRLYWEQAVFKVPESTTPVLWHQDNGYAYVEPQQYLTCWIALTDATLDNGCLSVMAGEHHDGTLRHRMSEFGAECWGDWGAATDLPVSAGDVVLLSSLTPHATRRNLTESERRAYIVQFMPDGAEALLGTTDQPPVRKLLNEERHVLHVEPGGPGGI